MEDRMRILAAAIVACLALIWWPLPAAALIIGPHTGTVVDSRTGDPIKGAAVLVNWIKTVPRMFEGPAAEPLQSVLVYTDGSGRYATPQLKADLGLAGVFAVTRMVVYQPGYEARIMEARHTNEPFYEKNAAFKETGNLVKLDRIPAGFDHRQHFETIRSAAWMPVYDAFPEDGSHLTWKRHAGLNAPIAAAIEEFLRRAQWEARRGRHP